MKFTTLIPTHWNDGTPVGQAKLDRIIRKLWEPFQAMTNEGEVSGHWTDSDGKHFTDRCVKIAIECERDRLEEAKRAVRRAGRELKQRAMYFEVTGYDGVQILRIT